MRFDPNMVNANDDAVIGKLSVPSYASRLHQRYSLGNDQILNKFKDGGDRITAIFNVLLKKTSSLKKKQLENAS